MLKLGGFFRAPGGSHNQESSRSRGGGETQKTGEDQVWKDRSLCRKILPEQREDPSLLGGGFWGPWKDRREERNEEGTHESRALSLIFLLRLFFFPVLPTLPLSFSLYSAKTVRSTRQ